MLRNTATTVLVVEDDPNLNLALVETLHAYGYATLSAYHGREALDDVFDTLAAGKGVLAERGRATVSGGFEF